MRSSNAPAETENTMSETNANNPAVTRSPANSKPTATAAMTAHTRSVQPKKPPSECSVARYMSSASVAERTTNMPAVHEERGARPPRAYDVHRRGSSPPRRTASQDERRRATSSRSRGDIGVPSEATMPRPRSTEANTATA